MSYRNHWITEEVHCWVGGNITLFPMTCHIHVSWPGFVYVLHEMHVYISLMQMRKVQYFVPILLLVGFTKNIWMFFLWNGNIGNCKVSILWGKEPSILWHAWRDAVHRHCMFPCVPTTTQNETREEAQDEPNPLGEMALVRSHWNGTTTTSREMTNSGPNSILEMLIQRQTQISLLYLSIITMICSLPPLL